MWNKQPVEESRLLGFANFFSPKVGSQLLRCQKFARSLFSFLALLMVFAIVSGFALIPVRSPSSTISFEKYFYLSLNGDLAWLVFAGSLDQEMLVPDVTLSVIKPN